MKTTHFEVSITDQHGEKMVMAMETEVVIDKVAALNVLTRALKSFEKLSSEREYVAR